jgi:LmbE family N-acetylglucosaminyl deacetylase
VLPLDLGAVGRPLRILAVGCHSDDIEIGCAGGLMQLSARPGNLELTWVVLAAGDPRRAEEAERSARGLLAPSVEPRVVLGSFRDGFLPYRGYEVKDLFERLKDEIDPDLILTHQRHDLHQDHRLACELTWNTFRDHLILEYEVPKYDGDMGAPNLYVPLSREDAERKVGHLMAHFASQRSKAWFTEDLFFGLMRIRGMECRSPSGLAEAFYARKVVLGG